MRFLPPILPPRDPCFTKKSRTFSGSFVPGTQIHPNPLWIVLQVPNAPVGPCGPTALGFSRPSNGLFQGHLTLPVCRQVGHWPETASEDIAPVKSPTHHLPPDSQIPYAPYSQPISCSSHQSTAICFRASARNANQADSMPRRRMRYLKFRNAPAPWTACSRSSRMPRTPPRPRNPA